MYAESGHPVACRQCPLCANSGPARSQSAIHSSSDLLACTPVVKGRAGFGALFDILGWRPLIERNCSPCIQRSTTSTTFSSSSSAEKCGKGIGKLKRSTALYRFPNISLGHFAVPWRWLRLLAPPAGQPARAGRTPDLPQGYRLISRSVQISPASKVLQRGLQSAPWFLFAISMVVPTETCETGSLSPKPLKSTTSNAGVAHGHRGVPMTEEILKHAEIRPTIS